jgi:hypothetical protein
MLNLDKVPKNLEEALEILDGLAETDKSYLKANGSVSVHFGFGGWLRNNWSLWEKDTPFVLWFNKLGIYHADDMSGIILEAFIARLRGEPYDMQPTIQRYRNHWSSIGLDPDRIME